MTTERLLQRVDELVETGNAVLRTRRAVNRHQELVDGGVMAGFRSASLSFIKMVYDQQHPYYVEFSDKTKSLFPAMLKAVWQYCGPSGERLRAAGCPPSRAW